MYISVLHGHLVSGTFGIILKNFAQELKRGDKVVTKSGMHGKIVDFSEKLNAVIIETGAGKITFDKSSISMELSAALNKPKDEKEKK